ncbi:sporulation protein [Bacillus solitudinis]|uniref:sporulation protein n=1 Tax=Bacillus solitudinis TaxID=2014074 RepID=UPI000C24B6E7|nr:sporulation protein [Bacillus solitudinis]
MDTNLAYLRESLSNHVDNHEICQRIYNRLEQHSYENEEAFVNGLDDGEAEILNLILEKEIGYARQEEDEQRIAQLSGVYELLI